MLSANDYVRVIALDFSKAFDTIRHATLIEKMANLQMHDHIYNWMKTFSTGTAIARNMMGAPHYCE